mgnify:FL=1
MKHSLPEKIKKLKLKFIKAQLIFWVGFLLLFFGGVLYIYNIHGYYKEKELNEVMNVAQSVQAFISPELLENLTATPNDIEKIEYRALKSSLIEFKNLNPNIAFAYIYTQKNGKFYFMVDSEAPDSNGYSPPGQEYTEANDMTKKPFVNGEGFVSEPITDRWGNWVSAVVPIKDSETGSVIAVFGMDYPIEYWSGEVAKHTVYAAIIVFFLLFLFLVLGWVFMENKSLGEMGNKLQYSEEIFRKVFEQVPIGIAIGSNYKLISNINPMFEKIIGRTVVEFTAMDWTEFTYPDDLEDDLTQFAKFKRGEIDSYSMKKRFIKKDGSVVWVNMIIAPLAFENPAIPKHLCLIQDITQSMKTEQALSESERSKTVLLANLPGMAYRCNHDRNWTMQFVSEGCFELTGYKSESLIYNKELCFSQLIIPEYRQMLWDEWARVLELRKPFRYEYEIITGTGQIRQVFELGQGVYDENGKVEALEGIIIDITMQKQRETQIKFLNEHDFLTGLYNRRFWEQEKARLDNEECLPLSIIVGDINGVKLVNDAFGYAEGDDMIKEAAKIMQSCCREGDILARMGGDEFAVLLPRTDKETAYVILCQIKQECNKYNKKAFNKVYSLNISLGYATRENISQTMLSIEKEAEDFMYTRKLLNRKSSHSSILASIMATMYAKSQETEEHAKRLAVMSKIIGKRLGLSQRELDELKLFAMLHDIGKIGIDDRILNKQDRLNDEEKEDMKKHPEIGYRIAMASLELEAIAEYILSHHERWDGKGYPRGLKNKEIPLLSRILSVVDAYDAMTEDRIYRKALSKQAAIKEIKNNAGTQFDPQIVNIFIEII